MRSLSAYLNDTPVGLLSERDDIWQFEYDPQWVARPDGFDLSPILSRKKRVHLDGGSNRPVQWYFDNLLPEEAMREAVSKQARIPGDDAFALLAYLGAESAGSLVLLPPGESFPAQRGLKPLPDEELAGRIRQMKHVPLSSGAPKRMSVAGAQHKLLVVVRGGALYEPIGNEPSTHILKPDHPSEDYPASVLNEYLTMRIADRLRLQVPAVQRRYTPEPIYLVERFDRHVAADQVSRRHIIDACQLLNKSRGFKHAASSLAALGQVIAQCRNRAATRLRLYQWLAFNVLLGNDDNHLKNLSFLVSAEGIALAPAYDLVCTAAYHTRAFADSRALWPQVPLTIKLPGAATFGEVTWESLVLAGAELGLPARVAERELKRMVEALPAALDEAVSETEQENLAAGELATIFLGTERHLTRVVQHIIVADMLKAVTSGRR